MTEGPAALQDKRVCMNIPQQECKESPKKKCEKMPKKKCKKVMIIDLDYLTVPCTFQLGKN